MLAKSSPIPEKKKLPVLTPEEKSLLVVVEKLSFAIPTCVAKVDARWDGKNRVKCVWPGTTLEIFFTLSGPVEIFTARISSETQEWTFCSEETKLVFSQISKWVADHAPYKSSPPIEIRKR